MIILPILPLMVHYNQYICKAQLSPLLNTSATPRLFPLLPSPPAQAAAGRKAEAQSRKLSPCPCPLTRPKFFRHACPQTFWPHANPNRSPQSAPDRQSDGKGKRGER